MDTLTLQRVIVGGAAVILGVIVFFVMRVTRRRLGSAAEPLGIFLIAWTVALALFAIPWVNFTAPATTAWILVGASIGAFSGGCTVVYLLPSKSPAPTPKVERIDPRRLRILLFVCIILAWTGFVAFLHAVNDVIGWSNVFTDPQLVRSIQTTSSVFRSSYGPWKLLTYFGAIAFLLWTVGLRMRVFQGWSRPLVVLGAFSLVPYLFTTDRTEFVTTAIWTGLFHLVWRPFIKSRRAALGVVLAAVVILGGFIVIGARRGTTIRGFPDIQRSLTTQQFSSLALPYLYLTSDVPILTQLMRDPNRPHTDGAYTFLPAVKLAHLAHLSGPPPTEVAAFYPVPFSEENVASWLAPFYLDYGLLGCIVIPLLLGLGTAAVARSALRRRTFFSCWLLAAVLLVTAATPVADKFSDTITWELVAAGLIVTPVLLGYTPRTALDRLSVRRRGRLLSRSSPLWISAVLLVVVLPATVAIASTQGRASDPASTAELRADLLSSLVKAQRAYRRFGRQASLPLVSQLRLSSPDIDYTPLNTNGPPPAPGTIGVLSAPDAITFKVESSDGHTVQLTWVEAGQHRGTYGPTISSPDGLLVNGSFEPPLDDWHSSSGTVANIRLDHRVRFDGRTALRITGARHHGTAKVLVQQILDLPSVATGATYRLRLFYRTSHLNRNVAVEIKYSYAGGGYQFFGGSALAPHRLPGIPRGSSHGWRQIEVVATAQKPLTALQVFAVDSGTSKLTGTVWLDRASLNLVGSQP